MSQNPIVVNNGSGASVRQGFNGAIDSIASFYSGTTDPATMAPSSARPFMIWADEGNELVKQRNSANSAWVTVGKIVNGVFIFDKSATADKLVTPRNINGVAFDGSQDITINTLAAGAPGYFRRDIPFAQSLNTKILTPNRLWITIGSSGYALETQQTFDVNQYASWDTNAASWQANKAYAVNDCVIPPTPNGYIYRCVTAGTSSALTPSFPVTLGQTYNDGNVVWICQLDYAYTPSIGTRVSSTAYTVGTLVRPATVNGYVYKCTTAGTTAATAPTFPTVPGNTVTDGTVVWTCQVGHNRAGRDFYIYACQPTSGIVPIILLSDNATIPLRYSASSSRKIGGFHCLCADVGTISIHSLTGYKAGDILPASVWDLNNRPISAPEGMVYDANTDMWVDIYLASVQGSQLASVYNAATADGASSPKAFHWYNGTDWMTKIKKKLMTQRDFVSASLGSNQGTNIAGGADPNTTGGHSDTAGRRMISNIGCEDMCGTLWQWGSEPGGSNTGTSWANAFDGNDTGVGGQHYQAPFRALLGGSWGAGAHCGSRASGWDNGPLRLGSDCGLRGCAEPLRGA